MNHKIHEFGFACLGLFLAQFNPERMNFGIS